MATKQIKVCDVCDCNSLNVEIQSYVFYTKTMFDGHRNETENIQYDLCKQCYNDTQKVKTQILQEKSISKDSVYEEIESDVPLAIIHYQKINKYKR